MATRTSVGSGLWSAAGTWDTGVPANTDTVVIATGHTVTFDVDQSAFAAGIGTLTIQSGATLIASTSAGNYYLKMAGHIQNSGTIQAGTSEAVRYPSNCTFTIYFNGNYQLNNQASHAGKVYFYCYQPVATYARLISATPKAITGISKAATCTVTCVGHGYSAGNTIYLVNVGGMVELNNLRVKVKTVLTDDTFTIRWYDADVTVDSSGFTTYTSGGYVCPEEAEAVGQTQLEVDTDLSADAEWTRSGAIVRIDNVNRTGQSEAYTISGAAAGYLTLSSGLTNAKNSSSLAILATRNIRINSSSTAISNGAIRYGSGCTFDCEIRLGSPSSVCLYNVTSSGFGGVITGATYAVQAVRETTISGIISGCTYGIYSGTDNILSGMISGVGTSVGHGAIYSESNISTTASSIISGCYVCANNTSGDISGIIISSYAGIYNSNSSITTSARIMGCVYGVSTISGVSIANAKLIGNGASIYAISGHMFNTLFADTVENASYNSRSRRNYICSVDHDQTAGAFRAWTRGGITSSTATDPPTGRVRSYQTVCESATYPGWYQREIVVDAGRQLRFRVWLKADAGVEIKAQLVLPTADPLITGTGTGEWQQIGTSDGTWHEYVTSWTNSATYPVTIYARVLSTAASGNGYSDMMWAFDRTPLVR